MSKVHDLTGQRFGRLLIIERNGSNKNGRAMWRCRCDCGEEVTILGSMLINGKAMSCGCLRRERSREALTKIATKHGGKYDRLYNVWVGMKKRCYLPSNSSYYNYGARGITVCDEWLNDYQAFKEWAYKNGYEDDAEKYKCTLDRIDSNGIYCPDNCRWVDALQQANNRRDNVKIRLGNEIHTVPEWSRITGISTSAIRWRIDSGWSADRILSEPVRKNMVAVYDNPN